MTATRTEQDWLASIHAAGLAGDWSTADAMCSHARAEYPTSADLCRLQAGICQQVGRITEAEDLFRLLLAQRAGDNASSFGVARLLGQQGRTAAAAGIMRTCLATNGNCRQPDLAISAIELLDDYGRKSDAAAIALAAVALTPIDTRLHAYAGMLQMQLGEFDDARKHYLYALANDPRAWEWHVPLGLANAQRYADDRHPDFERFEAGLQRTGLSDAARAELHFALGKANDDVGRYGEAAHHLRHGNRAVHELAGWSRKKWRRMVRARLTYTPKSLRVGVQQDFVPIFIVGMPRSGTTLLATLLTSAAPRVLNRGELAWIGRIAQQIDPNTISRHGALDLERAAAVYAAHLRQDDAGDAHWFIDKQPLNFRYVDLILALFPNARIIHCRRNPRDTALSLWMQCFSDDAHGYSYDFDDMAQVMSDETKLMAHWQSCYPDAIHDVHYEDLVAQPEAVLAEISPWIGFHEASVASRPNESPHAIATSSLWQVRQPVYTRSVGRWEHYATDVPELLRFHG